MSGRESFAESVTKAGYDVIFLGTTPPDKTNTAHVREEGIEGGKQEGVIKELPKPWG